MNGGVLFVDTMLLVLYVVGTASPDYIGRHKRLGSYVTDDYTALLRIIEQSRAVLVTPNTLTETSNLTASIAEPARGHVRLVLRTIIESSTELYIPSKDAAARQEFIRLGLTDTAILEGLPADATLLTVDFDLYLAAHRAGVACVNFNHIRETYL